MDAGAAVGGWRALVEHEGHPALHGVLRTLKQALGLPDLELGALALVGGAFGPGGECHPAQPFAWVSRTSISAICRASRARSAAM